MKKLVFAFLPWLFTAFGYKTMAQEDNKVKKEESQEIIIKKKGDKDTKLTVEITGDQVLINGKPLVEFKEDGITVNKKKIVVRDGSNFYFNDGNGDRIGSFNWNSDKSVATPFLGVTTESVDNGARIIEVTKESGAEKAGLQKDDIITKIADEKIDGPGTLSTVICSKKPKDELKVTYIRNGKEKTVKATLGEKKGMTTYSFSGPNGSFRSFSVPNPPRAPRTPGMEGFEELREIYPDLADNMGDMDFQFNSFPRRQKLGLKIQDTEDNNGVKILEVADSSAAFTAGLKKDDIITEIAGKKVNNTDEAREMLQDNEEKYKYNIKAKRNGSDMSFDIKIPKKLKTANL